MSEREFDNYLALLGGLLGLSAKQRTEIAGELRDHLEERLADLAASGLPRDEAVEWALAEFGDAASLAAAFLNVSRTRRKRWIMKWTAASIGSLAVAALLAVALWPEGANVKLTPKAVAQAAPGAPAGLGSALGPPGAVAAEPKKEEVKTREDNNAATEAVLGKQISAEFVETPLKEVIEYIRDLTGVEFYVNWKKLDEEGVEKEAVVNLGFKKIRVDMLLDLSLAQAGDNVAYVLRDGIVIISSAGDLENATEVRVYNCRDLLAIAPPGSGRRMSGGFGGGMAGMGSSSDGGLAGSTGAAMPGAAGALGMAAGGMMMRGMGGAAGPAGPLDETADRADQLIDVVITAVAPDSWQDNGGFGTVSEFSGMLVVNHNARTHRQIEKVLTMLREAVAKDAAAKGPGMITPGMYPGAMPETMPGGRMPRR